MSLTLVFGPANSAKAGHVLGAFADAAHRGALLVVPNAQDARRYSRELAGGGAVLGSVLTFSGLATEIARRAGYSARRLSPIQRERVLAHAISRTRPVLLARAAERPGFVVAAGELIAELERGLITPQRLSSALQTWAGDDQRRTSYAREVAAIYQAYVRELDRRGRVDGELYCWRALDALRAAPGAWGSAPVFFYGFDDLQALQRDAIETLARVAGAEVTVSLTYEAGRVALAARAEAVEELRPLADRVVELPAVDEHYAPASRAALHHLERSLFEGTRDVQDPGDAVRLLEAGGERAEAELLASEVRALLAAGIRAEEMAVVYRSPGPIATLLAEVFHRYGIALAGEHEVGFGQISLGASVLALTRCALLPQASAAELLRYLRSPGLLERVEQADALELRIRREGLRTAAQARAGFPRRLPEFGALASAPDQASELARQARGLLAAPGRGQAPLLDRDGELDAAALAAMLTAFDELSELGEKPAGSALIELLEALRVRVRWDPRNAVVLAAPLEIRARRFRAVLVGGLQEGEFPRMSAPEPFLSPELRRELAISSGLRLRSEDDGLPGERYLFYSAVSRATDRLVLSYRSSDEEGNLALASPFIADVADLFGANWVQRRRSRLLADVVWSESEAPTERELARSRAAQGVPDRAPTERRSLQLSDAALSCVRHREIVSGGALECYADCPVKWLVERELQPQPLDPEPEPLVRGQYMHEVLERVLRELAGAVTTRSLPEALSILERIVAEIPASVAPADGEGVREALLAGIRADLARYLRHEAAAAGGWEPVAVELRFGFADEEGSLPPLSLGDDVLVRGAIDRVDVDPTGRAVVRDYKSGSPRRGYQGAHWVEDHQLQVALYMLAVRELMGLRPVAGLYQPLRGPDLRARGLYLEGADVGSRLVSNDARDEHELSAVLAETAELARELALRLRAGELEPAPSTCARDGCAYPAICRSQ